MTSSRSFPFLRLLVAIVFTALAVGCQTSEPPSSRAGSTASPTVKYMVVDGARLPYVEQGTGEPVVLVHGAVGDYRSWDAHRPAIAQSGFRAVSYTMRYFGKEPWAANSPPFSGQLHSSDLASFIRGLNAGPVHLVSWSYSGQVVLPVALDNPELVNSVFAYELADPTYVTDQAALKTIQESSGVMFGPVVQPLKQGDESEATRKLIDGVAARSGYFEQQPARMKER
jgi:pimeloyl-ACP methyl ester carboxylesterase